jgi:hypothetical protein
MDHKIAKRLAKKLKQIDSLCVTHTLIDSHPAGELSGFHLWANDRPCLGAFFVSGADNRKYWVLIVDWHRDENFYAVLYTEDHKKSPIAEVHKLITTGDGDELHWNYSPAKQDGRNPERKARFIEIAGSSSCTLSLPNSFVSLDDFLQDLFTLGNFRVSADDLSSNMAFPARPSFPEGKRLERKHKYRERNPGVVAEAKRIHALNNDGKLPCEICGLEFSSVYGELGKDYIEGHHTKPLSSLDDNETIDTNPEDLAMVCANCHRLLHRKRPWTSMDELRNLLVR